MLRPLPERQQPHGDDEGVTEYSTGNPIDDARARHDPPRITSLTAADSPGSAAPLTEPAEAYENWV